VICRQRRIHQLHKGKAAHAMSGVNADLNRSNAAQSLRCIEIFLRWRTGAAKPDLSGA
jgi:hypothetical protein